MDSRDIISALQENWKEVGYCGSLVDYKFELKLFKKLLGLFQVSEFYYFIFMPGISKMEFVSPRIKRILGYEDSEFDTHQFLDSIHPDDLPCFLDFEKKVVQFKKDLPPDKLTKYKSKYNYRIQKKNGDYIPILQQSITIHHDDDGSIIRNLVVHTDLSEFRPQSQMKLSFMGLEGDPSYLNVMQSNGSNSLNGCLTKRELEIVKLISNGNNSKEIADKLCISPSTVGTHRKNIQAKTQAKNVSHLIRMASKNGWL